MDDTSPILLNGRALRRLLTSAYMRTGMEARFASSLAQVFLFDCTSIKPWHDWFARNCTRCNLSPESCPHMQPTEDECSGNLTPAQVSEATAACIEAGQVTDCPRLQGAVNVPPR